MVRTAAYVHLGFTFSMFQQWSDYGTIGLLYFSARRSCIMGLGIPGCDEGTLEIGDELRFREAKGRYGV